MNNRMFLVRVPGQGSLSEFLVEAADHMQAVMVYARAVRERTAPVDHEISGGRLIVCGSRFVDVTGIPHVVDRPRIVPWADMEVIQVDLTDFTLVPQSLPVRDEVDIPDDDII